MSNLIIVSYDTNDDYISAAEQKQQGERNLKELRDKLGETEGWDAFFTKLNRHIK